MVLLNGSRLVLLLGDSHRNMVWIMRRHLLVYKMTFIRTLIALVAARWWLFYQMDVKNTFLNGDLYKIVYM